MAVAVREKLPNGLTCFYVNPGAAQSGWAAGNNANDGLTQMTPKMNYHDALCAVHGGYDFDGCGQSRVEIIGAPNTTDTKRIHFAPHSLVGAQGGAALKIKGSGGSAISVTSGSAVESYFGSILQLENIKLSSTSGAAVAPGMGAKIYLNDGVELGSANGGQINIFAGGTVILSGDITVSGGGFAFLINGGGWFLPGAGSITFTQNVAYTGAFVYMNQILSQFSGIGIHTNGHVVTGQRFLVSFNGMLLSDTGNPNTYFPGTIAGQEIYGGRVA